MRLTTVLIVLLLLHSCQPKEDLYEDISLDEFILEDGFQIELVAAEPLLESPVAMCFDDKGRIWVAEMPGYMRDLAGSEEYAPDGRIVILEDTDGDGQMDKRKIFMDSLVLPRTLLLVYGGLLYAETPNLYWVSIENDQPSRRELVDSNYIRGGNIEHQPNGLLYNLDNWIYSARSQRRYRKKDGKWLVEATTFRGQWGLTNDDYGRLFYNDNSSTLYGDFMPPNILTKNPYQKVKHGYQQEICPDRRVYPYQPTSVNRGYQDGVLDSVTKKLTTFTSACGPLIYRGDNFPSDFYGNAFICGPEANLVKRVILEEQDGRISGVQAYSDREFLISKDETFRPINLYNAPDGAMYVLDLRKGVIQHRAYMTRYLRDQILEKGLDKVNGKGRIYRISYENKSKHLSQKRAKKTEPPFQILYKSIESANDKNAWVEFAASQSPLIREAAISGIPVGEELTFLKIAQKNGLVEMQKELQIVIQNKKNNQIQSPILQNNQYLDRRNRGMQLYATHCGSCHGMDGKGLKNLAPPLYQSEFVDDNRKLALIVLNGLEGAIRVNGQDYEFHAAMPAYKDNPDLTDEKLHDVLNFIKNGFANEPSGISKEEITDLRKLTEGRERAFTVEELEKWERK